MKTITIRHRHTQTALYSTDVRADDAYPMRTALARGVAARADLRGADLAGADLYDAYLRGADLAGANLHDANLVGANLAGANLYRANLTGANLHDAKPPQVNADSGNGEVKKRFVIVGNQSYGLYFGETSASDADVSRDKALRVDNCRHICHWRGKTGGITSLAAFGPCGPDVELSRIGAPAPSVLLTGIVNVLDCTPEAIANFGKVEASGG